MALLSPPFFKVLAVCNDPIHLLDLCTPLQLKTVNTQNNVDFASFACQKYYDRALDHFFIANSWIMSNCFLTAELKGRYELTANYLIEYVIDQMVQKMFISMDHAKRLLPYHVRLSFLLSHLTVHDILAGRRFIVQFSQSDSQTTIHPSL